jgi:hypothetical protein
LLTIPLERFTQNCQSAKFVSVFNLQVPAFDGVEFELGYDVLTFRKMDGSLIRSPVVPAGGVENSAKNKYESVSENEVILTQESSGEGQTTKTRMTFKQINGTWNQQQ